MGPNADKQAERGKRFGYMLAYAFALGMGSILVVWMVAEMTRTDKSDFLVTRMGLALGVCGLVLLASVVLYRRRRTDGRSEE